MVDQLGRGLDPGRVHDATLWLVLAALGDALLGEAMARALGLPRERARALARKHLIIAFAPPRDGGGVADGAPRA